MAKLQSWEVSDALWAKVAPLIPEKKRDPNQKYIRKSGGWRKSIDARTVFSGIVFVLRTGIQWKAIPKEQYGSPSAIHRYFLEWMEAGFFWKLWKKWIAELDELEGISWEWQSADSSSVKAPLAQESVGPNPTDRGKKWNQKTSQMRREWYPSVNMRNRSE
jgi:transposase